MNSPSKLAAMTIVDIVSSPNSSKDSALSNLDAADLGQVLTSELVQRWNLLPEKNVAGLILAQGLGTHADSSKHEIETNLAARIAQRVSGGRALATSCVDRADISGFEALRLAQLRLTLDEGNYCLVGAFDSQTNSPSHQDRAMNRRAKLVAKARESLSFLGPNAATSGVAWAQRKKDSWTQEVDFEVVLSAAMRLGVSKRELTDYLAATATHYAQASEVRDRELLAIHSRGQSLMNHPILLEFDQQNSNTLALRQAPAARGGIGILLAKTEVLDVAGQNVRGQIHDIRFATLAKSEAILAPLQAATELLSAHGLVMADLKAIEIHEEFAPQVMAIWKASTFSRKKLRNLGVQGESGPIPLSLLNRHGGVQSQGCPKNAASLQLVERLLNRLRAVGGGMGLAMIGFRGGQGAALLLEC